MSLREFVASVPKVELNLHLTGAFRRDSLLLLADQNAVPSTQEDFAHWLALIDTPDYEQLEEIARMAGSWVIYPEDIALVVYDIGVALSKQNVSYAEIAVAPSDFVGAAHMNFDTFIEALNDGRDRSLRGWGVDMAWILCIPRDSPRAGDDVARWATGSAAAARNVVALGLTGREDAQPIGQFRRAFATAQKKEVPTVANAGSDLGAGDIVEALNELQPQRLVDSWGIAEDQELLTRTAESGLPLVVSMSRAHKLGLIKTMRDYPLKALFEADIQIMLSSGMPSLYGTSLLDEYVATVEECGLQIDDLILIMRRSIENSFLDDERKATLLRRFEFDVKTALATYIGRN